MPSSIYRFVIIISGIQSYFHPASLILISNTGSKAAQVQAFHLSRDEFTLHSRNRTRVYMSFRMESKASQLQLVVDCLSFTMNNTFDAALIQEFLQEGVIANYANFATLAALVYDIGLSLHYLLLTFR